MVCASDDAGAVFGRFESLPSIVAVLERGERHVLALTLEGVPVTLVVAPPSAFGTELVRATGSAEYVGALGPLPDACYEPALFRRLGLEYCPPELRERAGAIAPPDLVTREAVRGDLHCHTTWSDGRASVNDMALAAQAGG